MTNVLAQYTRLKSFHNYSPLLQRKYYLKKISSSIFPLIHRKIIGRSKTSLSRRKIAALEEALIKAVGQLEDPILFKNLKTLGWLPRRLAMKENEDFVALTIQLPSLLHPKLDQLINQVKSTANKILHNTGLKVSIDIRVSKPFPNFTSSSDQRTEYLKALGPGLANVSHCLAVYSCKGGVGKSTTSVNLAYEMARMGGRIGLLDVDIYGPSLPILVKPDDPAVRQSTLGTGMVKPIVHRGVKLLSLGYVSPDSGVPGGGEAGGAAVMRGPMASRVVTQLLKGTEWGDLDVLVLDLPPGTGDVQLALCQDLRLTGAVAVTTPSKLALADAKKGIDMFTSLGVPTLAVVENMSYFVCDGGGRHYPFGKAYLEGGTKNIFQLPISTLTNHANDNGIPLSLERPSSAKEELSVIESLALTVSRELLISQHGQGIGAANDQKSLSTIQTHRVTFPKSTSEDEFDIASTHVSLSEEEQGFIARFFSDKGAMQIVIPAIVLRARHPKTGERVEVNEENDDKMVKKSRSTLRLWPAKLEPKGRYGYSIEWADGATIIYSMISIAKAAGAVPVKK